MQILKMFSWMPGLGEGWDGVGWRGIIAMVLDGFLLMGQCAHLSKALKCNHNRVKNQTKGKSHSNRERHKTQGDGVPVNSLSGSTDTVKAPMGILLVFIWDI